MEDYIQQVLAFDVREREPVRVEKMVALYTSRDRAINETLDSAGKGGRPLSLVRRGAGPSLPRLGGALGGMRSAPAQRCASAASAALSHLPPPAGLLARTRPTWMPGCPPAASTARRTAGTSSGTSSSSTHSSASGCRDHARNCLCIATGASVRPGRLRARPASRARCTRGRAEATARRRPNRPSQPAVGAVGTGPQPQPAPRQRSDLLQHLELPRGHQDLTSCATTVRR